MTDQQELPARFAGVQYRRAEIDGVEERMIRLRAVPYDVEVEVDRDLFESFEPTAFANAARDPGRVKLWNLHSNDGGRIVGQGVEVEDRPDGVLVRARVSATAAGDELLTLAADGVLDEASIEFKPIPKAMIIRRAGDQLHVRHRRAHLLGVALVPQGAYGRDAVLLSVRDLRAKQQEKLRAEALARLQAYNH